MAPSSEPSFSTTVLKPSPNRTPEHFPIADSWPSRSSLFIVNELPVNDDPDEPGSVPPRLYDQRYYPLEVARGYFSQIPGHVYR